MLRNLGLDQTLNWISEAYSEIGDNSSLNVALLSSSYKTLRDSKGRGLVIVTHHERVGYRTKYVHINISLLNSAIKYTLRWNSLDSRTISWNARNSFFLGDTKEMYPPFRLQVKVILAVMKVMQVKQRKPRKKASTGLLSVLLLLLLLLLLSFRSAYIQSIAHTLSIFDKVKSLNLMCFVFIRYVTVL